jgi:hypothetical protein
VESGMEIKCPNTLICEEAGGVNEVVPFLPFMNLLLKMAVTSMEFSAFSRPPKNPCSAGIFSPHNFSISLRGLYIGLIY